MRTRAIGTILVPCMALLCVTGLLTSCDHDPPDYMVSPTHLRLVPDVAEISPSGGSVFILAELTRPADKTGLIVVHFDSRGGEVSPAPGLLTCKRNEDAAAADTGTSSADSSADAGSDATSDVASAADVDAGHGGSHVIGNRVVASFATPSSLDEPNRHARTVALVLDVPAGDEDVLVTATALEGASATSCDTPENEIIAYAALRVTRTRPQPADAGSGRDSGDADSGAKDASTEAGIDGSISDAALDARRDGATDAASDASSDASNDASND